MSEKDEFNEEIEQTMQEASKKLNIDIALLRKITPEDVQYLLDRCPFLQIVGPEVSMEPTEVNIVTSKSGWDIHDYGDALSSSPGGLMFGGGNFKIQLAGEEDDDSGGGDIINPGKGTIVNQAWVTACEMIEMAQQRGWIFLRIVDGHRIMKRAAWIQASELGITVDGFEPSLEDEKIRQRVLESGSEFMLRKASKKSPGS